MRIPLQEIILWVLLPFLNFLVWFYVSHTGSLPLSPSLLCGSRPRSRTAVGGDTNGVSGAQGLRSRQQAPSPSLSAHSLEALLAQSQAELDREARKTRCRRKHAANTHTDAHTDAHAAHRKNTCSPPPPRGRNAVRLQDTMDFEQWRRDRLASMTVEIILKTYTDDDTVVLSYDHRRGEQHSEPQCTSYEHHMIGKQQDNCFAVVYAQDVSSPLNIARFDKDIDIYGLSISNPDPSQIDKYSA